MQTPPDSWETTSLGGSNDWPPLLRSGASFVAVNRLPMAIGWGEGLVCLCNRAFGALRRDAADASGGSLFDALALDRAQLASAIDSARAGRVGLAAAVALAGSATDDGAARRFDCEATPLIGDAGIVLGVLLTLSETDPALSPARRSALASEERYKTLAEGLPQLVWGSLSDGNWEYASPQWCRYTGQTREAAMGRGWLDAVHEDERQLTIDAWAVAADRGELDVDHRLRRHDGVYRWFQTVAAPLQADGTDPPHWFGACTDVDDLRRNQDLIRESEARLRLIIEAASDYAIIAFARDHRITSWSVGAELIFGASSSEMIGRPGDEIFTPEDRAHSQLDHEMQTAIEEGFADDERWHLRSDGRRVFVRSTLRPLPASEDDPHREFIKIARDETARRSHEEALSRLNETLEQRVAEALAERALWVDVFERTDALIAVVAPDGSFIAINQAFAASFERTFGASPAVGDDIAAAMPVGHPHRVAALKTWRRALAGDAFTVVDDFDAARGGPCYERRFDGLRDDEGLFIGALQYAVDVSDRLISQVRLVEAEGALRQSQKMEALGQITGGVAHDFNNLLTPIFGSLDMLQRRWLGDERERRLVGRALQAADRAKTLVQRLLAFARRQPLQPTAVDVSSLISGMVDILASTAGPPIRISIDAAPDVPAALADAHQLEMAVLNLTVNARDAMPDGGVLRIVSATESVGLDHPARLPPATYVRLSVIDSGVGMDAATLERAIEPFFSTKGVGQGTGLGLSMVHGLATQLGGALVITSRPEAGTRIDLYLPLGATTAPAAAATESIAPDATRHAGVVLLVDDEAIVRQSAADMLADLGYEVIEADSAEDALRRIESGEPFDVLVTDHLMPGMNGTELARQVRDRWPGRSVLVISGFAEAEGVAVDLPRLTKPFRQSELARMLTNLLPSARPPLSSGKAGTAPSAPPA